MKKNPEKIDLFPGLLKADGDKSKVQHKCTVALATKLVRGASGNAVSTSLTIDSSAISLPDGIYRLEVRGRSFKVLRQSGKWPVLSL